MNKPITLKDIATHFGVSISTVSKALKDSHEIGLELKEKIKNYATTHKYNPNRIALSLLRKRTKTIGLVMPTIHNHFFVKIFSGIEKIAEERGYNVITSISKGNSEKEKEFVSFFKSGMVDGLLVSITEETQSKNSYSHISDFVNTGKPIVMFDRVLKAIQCDKIITDDFDCSYKTTSHLIQTGCKHIAIVSVLEDIGLIHNRIEGYKKALKEHDISFNEKIICLVNTEDYDFETEVKTMLDYQQVDAIIGLEEFSTVEAMKIAQSRGYAIPEDISVMGFTSGNVFKYVNPSISCVNQHGEYIGKKAAEKLIDRIESEEENEFSNVFETKIIKANLVLRESTRAL